MKLCVRGCFAYATEWSRAILITSVHGEERHFHVHVGERPSLYFDYYNVPPHTYEPRWDAPGAPDVARSAAGLLRKAGFSTGEEITRGWDHGVFVPMKVAQIGRAHV